MGVVTDAGRNLAEVPKPLDLRKARILEAAKRLRGAQSDEEAAEALEAAIELSKE